MQKLPGKVDVLHNSYVNIIVASKFHSVAVTASGELYTWGFGRGGRLGHPEFDIHRYCKCSFKCFNPFAESSRMTSEKNPFSLQDNSSVQPGS